MNARRLLQLGCVFLCIASPILGGTRSALSADQDDPGIGEGYPGDGFCNMVCDFAGAFNSTDFGGWCLVCWNTQLGGEPFMWPGPMPLPWPTEEVPEAEESISEGGCSDYGNSCPSGTTCRDNVCTDDRAY